MESPNSVWAHRFLAPSYTLSANKDTARASLAALETAYPAQVRSALRHITNFVDRAANGLESIGMRLWGVLIWR